MLAWKLVQQHALQDAARYERDCRGLAPTGGHTTVFDSGRGAQDASTGERKGDSKHAALEALAIAGPQDDHVVDLLEALPEGEKAVYSEERNVVDYNGKSATISDELEERFTGRVHRLLRELPAAERPPEGHVGPQGPGGRAGALRLQLRAEERRYEAVMMRANNYVWSDPHCRGDHGMHGGAALASMCAPTD